MTFNDSIIAVFVAQHEAIAEMRAQVARGSHMQMSAVDEALNDAAYALVALQTLSLTIAADVLECLEESYTDECEHERELQVAQRERDELRAERDVLRLQIDDMLASAERVACKESPATSYAIANSKMYGATPATFDTHHPEVQK